MIGKCLRAFLFLLCPLLMLKTGQLRADSDLDTAINFAKAGDLASARHYFHAHLNNDPKSERALNGLGHTYVLEGDFSKAVEAYGVAAKVGYISSKKYMVGTFLKQSENKEFKPSKAVENCIPDLINHMDREEDVAAVLMLYAFRMGDADLFHASSKCISAERINKNPNEKRLLELGLQKFGPYEE